MKTDAELCAAWRGGNREALAELYRRNERMLRGLAAWRARAYPIGLDAGDAMSAGCEALMRCAARFQQDGTAKFSTLLYTMASRAMRDAARKWTHGGRAADWRREEYIEGQVAAPVADAEPDALPERIAQFMPRLRAILPCLTLLERKYFKARLSGQTPGQIAHGSGRNVAQVLSILKDARVALRKAATA